MPVFDARTLPLNTPVPNLLRNDGAMKLLSAGELDAIPADSLRMWCHVHGRYGLVTTELIAWLRDFIGDRSTIEIGSGAGDLCTHLGIIGTDSKCQNWPDVAAYYRASGQPTIRYPASVLEYDALAAIRKTRPQTVIASWVTHWVDPKKPPPPGGGSMYGVKETDLLKTGVTYVLIGNLRTHAAKPILKQPHEEIALPFLRSRGQRDLDRIFIWNRQK